MHCINQLELYKKCVEFSVETLDECFLFNSVNDDYFSETGDTFFVYINEDIRNNMFKPIVMEYKKESKQYELYDANTYKVRKNNTSMAYDIMCSYKKDSGPKKILSHEQIKNYQDVCYR